MKKQKRQLLILLAVLVLFVAGFWGIRQYNKVQSEKPQEKTGITVVESNLDDILKFSYNYEGVTYSFEKKEDTWYAAGDDSLKLVQTDINSMITDIAPMVAVEAIENVSDISQYGLAEPSRTISFETATESHIFYVGDYNSLSSVYYICKPSDTTVYLVPALTVNRFNKTLEELVEEETQTGEETPMEEETQTGGETQTEK